MSTITEADVMEALNKIVDPCSATMGVPAGMVDMGLIGDVTITDDHLGGHKVRVKFGMTDPTCMLASSFSTSARERLAELPDVTSVEVQLDSSFEWSSEKFAPHYKRRLDEHRAKRRALLPLTAQGGSPTGT